MSTGSEQPEDLVSLYRRAFAEYSARCGTSANSRRRPRRMLLSSRAPCASGQPRSRAVGGTDRAGLPCRYL